MMAPVKRTGQPELVSLYRHGSISSAAAIQVSVSTCSYTSMSTFISYLSDVLQNVGNVTDLMDTAVDSDQPPAHVMYRMHLEAGGSPGDFVHPDVTAGAASGPVTPGNGTRGQSPPRGGDGSNADEERTPVPGPRQRQASPPPDLSYQDLPSTPAFDAPQASAAAILTARRSPRRHRPTGSAPINRSHHRQWEDEMAVQGLFYAYNVDASGMTLSNKCLVCEDGDPILCAGRKASGVITTLRWGCLVAHHKAVHPTMFGKERHWCKWDAWMSFYKSHRPDPKYLSMTRADVVRDLFAEFRSHETARLQHTPIAFPHDLPSSLSVHIDAAIVDGVLRRMAEAPPDGSPVAASPEAPRGSTEPTITPATEGPVPGFPGLRKLGGSTYEASIDNTKQLLVAKDWGASGLPFACADSIAAASRAHNSEPTVEGGINRGKFAWFVHVICMLCLCMLAMLMRSVWTYALAIDSATFDIGVSMLIVDIRIPWRGEILTFHLFGIPVFEHGAEYLTREVARVLTSLDPRWKRKLLGVTSDGATVMFGHEGGLTATLCEGAARPFYGLWCGAHMDDLAIGDAVKTCYTVGPWAPEKLGSLDTFVLLRIEAVNSLHSLLMRTHTLTLTRTCSHTRTLTHAREHENEESNASVCLFLCMCLCLGAIVSACPFWGGPALFLARACWRRRSLLLTSTRHSK
eukprot:GHVU01088531.1.p1 GENE.GHVU01088531.1~~GHVU01088531.1.p1  ORF type:complete len:688 (+),score=34.09 GHVU01088531.1:636-2699(+)